jgi:uncharacterized protein (DUF1697 family)
VLASGRRRDLTREAELTRSEQVDGVHVALLRGINVGGKNRLPMKELATIFTAAGCTEVQTSIQSGNVVFRAAAGIARRIPTIVADGIERRFGFRVPVVTVSAAGLREVVTGNPFLAAGADPAKLHVAFLADRPSEAGLSALDPEQSPPDEFELIGRVIYLLLPNGVARSRLTNAYFDATLGTTSTARNWKTVLRLHELAGGFRKTQ